MKLFNSKYAFVNVVRVLIVFAVFSWPLLAQSNAENEGREIFEKYQAAIGGRENLAKIKTVEVIAETEGLAGKSKTISIQDKTNNKSYFCGERDSGIKTEMGFDGSRHWMRRGGQAGYINATSEEETIKYVKLPNETIDGREYLVVEEVKANPRDNAKGFYDPGTFLLARREKTVGFSGEISKLIKTYADYRKVGDILVSFLETSTNNISGTSTLKVLSIKHNIEVSPTIFELKSK